MWVNISLVVYPVLGDELGWSIQVFIQFLMDGKDGGRHSAGVVEWNMPMVFCLSVFWPSGSTMITANSKKQYFMHLHATWFHAIPLPDKQRATSNSLPKFQHVSSLQQEANGHNDYPAPHFQQSLGTFGIRMPADAAEPKFPLMHSEKHAVPARRPSAWHTIPDSTWRRCYESLLKYCHVFFIFFLAGDCHPGCWRSNVMILGSYRQMLFQYLYARLVGL